MSDDITKWLDKLGLSEFANLFADEQVVYDDLRDLTDADLKDLGIPLGPRKRLLRAISELQTDSPPVQDATQSPTLATPRASEAERRQLTVMFCDLVGSTELSQKLDPEDLRDINRAYQDACKAAIERYEGYVARYMGDGVLAYFGYPQAHEDDAERAIHAGLGVVASVARIDSRTVSGQDIELSVRVGIATGTVVVGDLIGEGASQENAVVGETPNRAARLQGMATENTVVIGPGTYGLAGERFEYEDLGALTLKGIAAPASAWRVIGAASSESRFEITHRAGLTPLVGREYEIGLLLDRWIQAKDGEGQVVLLSGEAGIGKSRIAETLQERIAAGNPIRFRYQCSPYYTNSALHPVIEQLERSANFNGDDTNERKLEKLESSLDGAPSKRDEVASLLTTLLSIPANGRYPVSELTPERQRQATLEALVARLEAESRKGPVLVVFEDAHWADPTSVDFLELAISRVQELPVLVVITFRPEFSPPWADHTHGTSLALNRLARSQANEMVERITGGKPLPGEVHEQIIEKTDGVPLFVEELTKTILESGVLRQEADRYVLSGPLSEVAIPTTLHDSLMARLDRLGAVKGVAQTASVIGREFDNELLEAISPMDELALQSALDRLVGSGLIYQTSRTAGQKYLFKHALVQNAAYQSLLRSRRQEIHKRIAKTLEDSFPDTVETQPELLAHHYTEADMAEPAIEYWKQAGQRATERSADLEAVGHFTNGLTTLAMLPESTERDRLQLGLQLPLTSALSSTRGWGSAEANAASARSRELCERLGETAKLIDVFNAEAVRHIAAGEYQMTKDVAASQVKLSEQYDDELGFVTGTSMLGWGGLNLGEFSLMQPHADEMLKRYNSETHATYRFRWPLDFRVNALGLKTHSLWFTGFPDQSIASSDEAVAYAREIDQDSSLAWALTFAGAQPAALRRDTSATEKLATEITDGPEDKRSPIDLASCQIFSGWAIGKRGELERGISAVRQGNWYLETRFQFTRTTHLALLAELCIDSEDLSGASSALEEASIRTSKLGERMWEAEILRLKAEVCVHKDSGQFKQAETLLMQAMEVARSQAAKSLELRSSVALGKLWQQQDKRQAAHDLVVPVYDWFTEGFDTPDLKEAKALMEELS